jgi:hypothetical protein
MFQKIEKNKKNDYWFIFSYCIGDIPEKDSNKQLIQTIDPGKRSFQPIMALYDIISAFREMYTESVVQRDFRDSVLDDFCGCMVSKWMTIEFSTIVTPDDETHLHVACIYLQAFSDFDYCDFTINLENVPTNILKLYKYAKQYTTFSMDAENVVEIVIPYIYKNSRTILKRCNLDILVPSCSPSCVHISEPEEIKKLDKLFQTHYYGV